MQHFKETIGLLENSSFYYAIAIGMDNRYTYVSPNYDKNFSFINTSLLGKPFYITLHPDDIIICQQVGAQCFEHPDRLFPATLRKHNGQGGFISTQWELKAFFDENNNPEGIFCIGYNITEHVDTRNKLLNAKTEIDQKTGKLHEIGFIQSHVIRKPLANIIGLVDLLSTMSIDNNLKDLADMLANSARELDTVVKNIVDKTA